MKLTVSSLFHLAIASLLGSVSVAHASGLQEVIYSSGSYQPFDYVSGAVTYNGVAYNTRGSNTNVYMATRADGGVDEVYYNGVWNAVSYPLGGTLYGDVTYNNQAANTDLYMATRETGGFEEIAWIGGNFVGQGVNNPGVTYTGVAYNGRAANPDTYLATRADGGIDEIMYSVGWATTTYGLGGVQYTDITYNSQTGNVHQYMATRADGGIEEIYWNGSEYAAGDLVNPGVVYNGVAYNALAGNVNVFLATRADGGVDEIYYDGSWNVVPYAVDGLLLGDLTQNTRGSTSDFYFATVQTVPEPGTWAMMVVGLAALAWTRRRGK